MHVASATDNGEEVSMEPNDLLIVEAGVNWTEWIRAQEDRQPRVISVFQQSEESAADFVARVGTRLDCVLEAATPIRRLTVLGRDDWEIATLRTRLAILRKVRESGLPVGIGVDLHLALANSSDTTQTTRGCA
jgi:hypothetical protein